MRNGKQEKRTSKFVSASELAQMGACERYIAFEKRYGKIRSPEQIKAMQRGNNAHDKFHREALTVNPRVRSSLEAKPWCFIASCAFPAPDAPETKTLRAFRDRILRRSQAGRRLIILYYRWSAPMTRLIGPHPAAMAVARVLLRPVVMAARLVLKGRSWHEGTP